MKITDMRVTPIAFADPPLLCSMGLHAPYALRTIVELVTDEGIYGLGEVPGGAKTTGALEAAQEVVVGKDPFQLNAIRAGLSERFGEEGAAEHSEEPWDHRRFMQANSAVEVACYDIIGKATGRPVVDLLGGRARDRVDFAAYLFYKYAGAGGEFGFDKDPSATEWAAARQAEAVDPAGIVAEAKAMCDYFGFKSIKLKAGIFPPEEEVAAIKAMADAFGPEMPLRIDPNAVWSTETSIDYGKQMLDELEYYEDPVRGQESMAEVGKALGIPMATNMCTTAFSHIPNSIKVHSEDVILSDHHGWGGLRSTIQLARICKTFGRGVSMHSNSHLGITLAAMVHVAAAIPNLDYACDTHYPWQREEVITSGRFVFEDGALPVSSEPGLGVELDRDALAKLHQQYIDCGIRERNDAVEMKKLNPEWEYMATRY